MGELIVRRHGKSTKFLSSPRARRDRPRFTSLQSMISKNERLRKSLNFQENAVDTPTSRSHSKSIRLLAHSSWRHLILLALVDPLMWDSCRLIFRGSSWEFTDAPIVKHQNLQPLMINTAIRTIDSFGADHYFIDRVSVTCDGIYSFLVYGVQDDRTDFHSTCYFGVL